MDFGVGLEGGKGEGNLFRAVGRIFGQVGDVVESGGVKNAREELVMNKGAYGIGVVWSYCFEGLLSEGGAEIFSVIGGGWELGCSLGSYSGGAGVEEVAVRQIRRGGVAGPSEVAVGRLQVAGVG